MTMTTEQKLAMARECADEAQRGDKTWHVQSALLAIERMEAKMQKAVAALEGALRELHEAMADVMMLRRISTTPEQREIADGAIAVWRKTEAALKGPDERP